MQYHARNNWRRERDSTRLNAPDANILDRMADIIAGRPMPPTTAMRQLGIEDDTMIRRLRRKWNAGGPVRVQAIKARHQRAQLQVAAKVACEKFYAFANAPELAAAAKSINAFAASPVWLELGRKFEAVSKSPFMQAIQAFANTPEAKRLAQWTELANNPEVRRWADLSRSLQTTLPRHFIPPRG
jgi:hypothetical protein